ncbi:MAG TPA: PIN domain-containing protein [Blastocatellia bacterium]
MTTPAAKPVFVDTNILVYSKLALSPFHSAAVDRLKELDSLQAEVWVSRQVFREYVAVMSRPGVVAGAIPMTSLTADIRSFAARFEVANEDGLTTDRWLTLLDGIPSAGKQVHDANIVATMLTNNVHFILTHNVADFVRFSGLVTIIPLIK